MSKQVLDLEQMLHLRELGLELKETTLIYAGGGGKYGLFLTRQIDKILWESTYPAYTLQDVLDALPIEIKYKDKRCWLCIELADEMIGYYYENARFEHRWVYYEVVMIDESLIDAVYKLLCWAIEQGYVETNKNK